MLKREKNKKKKSGGMNRPEDKESLGEKNQLRYFMMTPLLTMIPSEV